MNDKELNQLYNSIFPSFLEEKKNEAIEALNIYKKDKTNTRAKKVIINAYLDIIRFTIGEYAYENHINFIKNEKNIDIELENALNEFNLRL